MPGVTEDGSMRAEQEKARPRRRVVPSAVTAVSTNGSGPATNGSGPATNGSGPARAAETLRLDLLAHDLRNQLTSVFAIVMTMRSTVGTMSRADQSDMLDRLRVKTTTMQRLLVAFLDLQRIERNGFLSPPEATDVSVVVRQVVDSVGTPDHPIELVAHPLLAEVDAFLLERILENLLSNVNVHTPPGTAVRVVLEQAQSGVLLRVDDAGGGVPVEERELVFERHRRGSTLGPGAGLGLSIVAECAALHGGHAWTEESPGGGASFRVFLPTDGKDPGAPV
ncbi:MAG TPA: HAMP domain-containing sensor histidine kinase [Actinomycetota bacterium]